MKTLTFYRGDDVPIAINVQNDDDSVVDLTGATIIMSIATNAQVSNDGQSTSVKAAADTGKIRICVTTHTVPTQGKTLIKITHDQTEAMLAGTYTADVRLKDAGGNYTTIGMFILKCVENVTRDMSS